MIRPADPSESELLTELAMRSKAHWGYSAAFMQACRAELSVAAADITSPGMHYFVVELAGNVVGFYALERLSDIECRLEALFVEPGEIGKGHGRLLIEHAKEYARKLGARSLIIQGDPNAARFYRAAGGVQVGESESESIPGRYLPEFEISLAMEQAIDSSGEGAACLNPPASIRVAARASDRSPMDARAGARES